VSDFFTRAFWRDAWRNFLYPYAPMDGAIRDHPEKEPTVLSHDGTPLRRADPCSISDMISSSDDPAAWIHGALANQGGRSRIGSERRQPCRYCPDPRCPEDCPECGSPIHDLDGVPPGPDTRARRGDAFEAWLKSQRDEWDRSDQEWGALDHLLDTYRLHADTGTPLSEHVCKGRTVGDCECFESGTPDMDPGEGSPGDIGLGPLPPLGPPEPCLRCEHDEQTRGVVQLSVMELYPPDHASTCPVSQGHYGDNGNGISGKHTGRVEDCTGPGCGPGGDLEVTDPHEIGTAHDCPEGCATHNPGGPDVPREVWTDLYGAAEESATIREGHADDCMWFVSPAECSCHVWPAARIGVDTAWDALMSDRVNGPISVPREALRGLIEVAMWVSRGRSAAFTADPSENVGKVYPDAKARRALGALDDAGLLDQFRGDDNA
jgi:hypothetical protein